MKPTLPTAAALLCVAACGVSNPVNAPLANGPLPELGPGAETLTSAEEPIVLRRSAVADEYFWLRAKVLEGEAPPEFAEPFAAMKELRAEITGDLDAWEDLEVPLGSVQRASELVALYTQFADKRTSDDGNVYAFREPAVRLARGIEATERVYRAGPYKEHSEDILRAAKGLEAVMVPREAAILGAIESDLELSGAPRPVVVTLVADAPYPGIFAADDRGHEMASFVRVRGLEGSALVETVLHESLHAIDEVTVREKTAMNALRTALTQKGIDAEDTNVEMAVNTVTFAEAASLVRRFVDPAHKPMGEGGFYTLYPPAPAIVAAWDRHVGPEALAIEATATAIAQAVTSP